MTYAEIAIRQFENYTHGVETGVLNTIKQRSIKTAEMCVL
jgi:hypothetical protein